jgi:periplasmic protein TonB
MHPSSCLAISLVLTPALTCAQAQPAPVVAAPLPAATPPIPASTGCVLEPYPVASVAAAATGRTILGFSVDENGYLFHTTVIRTAGASREHKLLDAAAVRSLWTCRFAKPERSNALFRMEYTWELPASVRVNALR